MKVIRLTYRDAEIEPSIYLLLFFRFAGVYVYERFWGTRTVQIELLGENTALFPEKERQYAAFAAYDCDVCIVRDASDLQEYDMLADKRPESMVLLTRGELAEDAIDYAANKELALLQLINNKLLLRRIITPDEKEDLDILADIYATGGLMSLMLKAKYFFSVGDEPQLTVFRQRFENIVTSLLNQMNKIGCTWGDRRFFHVQYAALNAIYELNCFCVRYKKGMVYRKESLLRLCDTLETGLDGLLGDSVKMLKGQIYDDLFFNPNAAYERYVNCCNDITYNAYVYFRKGGYWQDFGNDWEQALKYYVQAAYIYPEYYRAWYKIGLCNLKLGRNREAVAAYENVRKCLSGRIAGKCVRAMEIEHIFKAQTQMAEIWEKNGSRENAIESLKWAVRAWNLIDETSFFELICDEDEKSFYQERTKDNLDIEDVYEKLIVLNTIVGNKEAALHYQEKLG